MLAVIHNANIMQYVFQEQIGIQNVYAQFVMTSILWFVAQMAVHMQALVGSEDWHVSTEDLQLLSNLALVVIISFLIQLF